MDVFYYFAGQQVIGPHSLREMQEMYAMATIATQTPVIKLGEKDWQTLGAYCDLNSPECQPLNLDLDFQPLLNGSSTPISESPIENATAEPSGNKPIEEVLPVTVTATEEQKASLREEEEEIRQQRTTRHQLLRQVRAELDQLWEAQRESIIARIRFEQLSKDYEASRRRNRDIYRVIEENALEYWRRSGLLTCWIRELTWREHDFTVRLRGKTEEEKYFGLQNWLEESRLADIAGCYCFKNGREYIYIGQAAVLRDRIKQHEKKTYFTYATNVRIIIPKNKRQLNQLERLLILAHQPTGNSTSGTSGRTPVDDCLEFIRGEIKELITDF
jgi:chemotaxis protein histidine kinase CheA